MSDQTPSGHEHRPFADRPTNRRHVLWTDEWYLRNDQSGKPDTRYFFPISHTNPDVYLTWDSPREFALLRSHAVADDMLLEMATALEAAGCTIDQVHTDCPGCAALARYNKLMEKVR